MSAPRPSEADVEHATDALLASRLTWGTHSDRWGDPAWQREFWTEAATIVLAARDAHHEREAMDRYWEGYGVGRDEAETRDLNYDAMTDRAKAAERALADRDTAIKALWVKWQTFDVAGNARAHWMTDLHALLPREDAAGAGGAE